MSECGGWKPVSISPLQPYDPVIIIPTIEELQAMEYPEFNAWRKKAWDKWYYFMRKKWLYKGFTDEQNDELQAIFRAGRAAIFGTKKYHCYKGKKEWHPEIDMKASWEASKPAWYPAA
ncbi:MAG: hypothetical protein M0R06_25995 [Sphaerochaeta sp.]|jgi:hypothetical protein|nr:hypothetical protein [Sphaerochaeta sp.]